MYYNKDLENDLYNISFWQESIETDITKLAVCKAEDFNLEMPFTIDVEDESYFYHNETERDKDYEELMKFLTNNTNKYFY